MVKHQFQYEVCDTLKENCQIKWGTWKVQGQHNLANSELICYASPENRHVILRHAWVLICPGRVKKPMLKVETLVVYDLWITCNYRRYTLHFVFQWLKNMRITCSVLALSNPGSNLDPRSLYVIMNYVYYSVRTLCHEPNEKSWGMGICVLLTLFWTLILHLL